jgi:hypothetical protein
MGGLEVLSVRLHSYFYGGPLSKLGENLYFSCMFA